MGVATSDPEYLEAAGRNARNHPTNTPHRQLHYERYLETPKTGKSIFIARKERSRAHARLAILLVIIVIVAVLAWFFFLK